MTAGQRTRRGDPIPGRPSAGTLGIEVASPVDFGVVTAGDFLLTAGVRVRLLDGLEGIPVLNLA